MSNLKLKYFVVYFEAHPDAPNKKFFDSVRDSVFLTKDRVRHESPYFDSIEDCQSFIGFLSHFNYPVVICNKFV